MSLQSIKRKIEIVHYFVLLIGFFLILVTNPELQKESTNLIALKQGFQEEKKDDGPASFSTPKAVAILPQKSKKKQG